MQLGDLAAVFSKAGNNTARIWKLLAFVGRYGHQPINVALRLPVRDLGRLADCIAEIVKEENAAGSAQRED